MNSIFINMHKFNGFCVVGRGARGVVWRRTFIKAIKEGMAQHRTVVLGGILLGTRFVPAWMSDMHASCVCCLGSWMFNRMR